MKLLEIKQALLESRSIATVLVDKKAPERAEFFFKSIKDKVPFPIEPSKKDPEPQPIVIDPGQLPELQRAHKLGNMNGIKLRALDGRLININNLIKTAGLGGKEAETIPVKPTDVFAGQDIDPEAQNVIELLGQAGAFPVSDLNNQIQNNAALDKVGPIGQAIKEIADQISNGLEPTMPDYLKPEQKKAIELYAGEYLGVLSIFHKVAKFDKRAEFDEFLGTDLGELMLYFPRSQSNPLADSFAIQNETDGHALKISSKAAGKGAAPSLEGLKIPQHVRDNKAFRKEVAFIDEAKKTEYTAFTQPFHLMNYMFKNMPDTLNEKFYPYLPWTQEWIDEIKNGLDPKDPIYFPRGVMKDIIATIPRGRPNGTDSGVIWYAVITDVLNAVNKRNALPQLKPVVLETLGYNFMQVYTTLAGNKLKTKVFWPAKIDGKVQLKTKGYAGNPNYGKLGFQVSG
jgi:hypothetical protein